MFFRTWRPHHLFEVTRQGFVGTLFECVLPPGRFYGTFVPLWCHFVRFLDLLGLILEQCWTILDLFVAIWCVSQPISGTFGIILAIFGPFWSHVVSSWPSRLLARIVCLPSLPLTFSCLF